MVHAENTDVELVERVLCKSYDDIVGHCCDAWNNLTNQPWTIMSIGLRDSADGS